MPAIIVAPSLMLPGFENEEGKGVEYMRKKRQMKWAKVPPGSTGEKLTDSSCLLTYCQQGGCQHLVRQESFCNMLDVRLPFKMIWKLHLLQNVGGPGRWDHIYPFQQQLHWLPISPVVFRESLSLSKYVQQRGVGSNTIARIVSLQRGTGTLPGPTPAFSNLPGAWGAWHQPP